MRWRLGASVLTVLTAAIAIWAAVLGPLYQFTAGDSVLRATLASAAVQDSGVTLITDADQTDELGAVRRAEEIARRAGGARPLYGAPITTITSGVILSNRDKSQLFWRTGICHLLHFLHGACNLGAGEVVMTARGARQIGAAVGSVIAAHLTGRSRPLRLRVTGIAAVPDLRLPYWWGDGIPDFPMGSSRNLSGPAQTDPLIASAATALAVPPEDVPAATGQLPLRPGAIGLGDEGGAKAALRRMVASLDRDGIRAGTRLPSLLSDADHQRGVTATIVAVAAIQLVLLAVWVLGALLVRSGDIRRAEARVARLRGFPAASMLWVAAAEPGLLCAFGAVLGVAAAWATMVLARAQWFSASAAIAFDGWTFAALGVTVAAMAGALAFATARLLRSTALPGDSARARSGASAFSGVTDVVLVVLAIAALVELASTGALTGHTDPLASAAPGLIALGTAVLAVQLLLFACRLGIRATATSGRVGSFLAVRHTVRRPQLLRQARVLTIALGLACFAAAAWSVSRTNRSTAAQFQTGARTVVSVTPQTPTGLEQAVRRADPHGRFAMAAVDLRTPSTTLVGVDSSRLANVASWPSGISDRGLRSVAERLAPPAVPPVQLPDGSLSVTVLTTSNTTRTSAHLGVWLFNRGTAVVDLGGLEPGRRTYHSDLSVECPGGCRLVGVGLLPAPGRRPPATGAARLTIERIGSGPPGAASRVLSADFIAGGWRPGAAGVRVHSGPRGLTLSATAGAIALEAGATGASTPPMAAPADHPEVLPVVATSELESLNNSRAGPLATQGLDGNSIDAQPVVTASALPRLGRNALMADLGLLANFQSAATSPGATDEVWLGPGAPADALAKLRAAGLQPTSIERSSTLFGQLQRSGPALADDFLLLATIAALLVATASTLGTLGTTTRERATELASLEVAGVPLPALARSLGLESGILILTALCGIGAGVLAAAIAVPSMPELASVSFSPVSYSLPTGTIAAVALLVLAAVAVAAGATTAVILRRTSPGLLRLAPDDLSV